MDSPWDEDATPGLTSDAEWAKMSNEFTNAGYREGITAGKESALQEGFDSGFAEVGAPIGRELGHLRGVSSGIVSYLSNTKGLPDQDAQMVEAREIATSLSNVRFSDIAPRDLEAEEHAKEHLEMGDEDDEMDVNEELDQKNKMEGLEDMLARLTAAVNPTDVSQKRPTWEDVQQLKNRLQNLAVRLGLPVTIIWR
ncbi:hypothetical protein L218DRAFT_962624 [Marasmius fiardii PR-910]|nr:hypothetical protein L218DRAFT_962624 [Marasmius fiardii PR-910]